MVGRIATLETVQPDALKVEMVMQRKFATNTNLRASQVGGVQAAAKIMNFTKQDMEARIMKTLAKDDKNLMVAIQESMSSLIIWLCPTINLCNLAPFC